MEICIDIYCMRFLHLLPYLDFVSKINYLYMYLKFILRGKSYHTSFQDDTLLKQIFKCFAAGFSTNCNFV